MTSIKTDLNTHIDKLSRALGLESSTSNELKGIFVSYSDENKYKLIDKTGEAVTQLLSADQSIKALFDSQLLHYQEKIKANWNSMNKNLVELQILTLIQKKENCDKVIDGLLDVLNKKIKIVNETLKQNLSQAGGSNDKYIKKYLKYKNKYLSLKKI
jgi:hypothetical protein